MRFGIFAISALTVLPCTALPCPAQDWITAPSYFTHSPKTGERVNQFAPIGPFFTYSRSDFRRSGYRNTRSSIQVGGSSDNYHTVEEWGRAVRPYGEWRFPFRPYSVPYGAWGPQPVPGFGPFLYPPAGGAGGVPPVPALPPGEFDDPRHHPNYYHTRPWHDGRHPPYWTPDPYERQQLLPSDPPPIP